MKIVMAGGSGQVGRLLARAFVAADHRVVALSRHPGREPWPVVVWDGKTLGDWTSEIDGCDVVINLAGRSVNCRYTPENRRQMLDSRLESTRAVGQAIARAARPPGVWLQAGTATIYAHRFDAPNDEATGIIGGTEPDAPDTWRFSIAVATAWEAAVNEAVTPKTRKVIMRSAMTMSPDPGGIFDVLATLVKRGLGGTAGSGKQYISWIHGEDFVNAVSWIMERENLSGPINICSPNPLPNAQFMRVLREACGARIGLPATRWMLEMGAVFMRTETELILKSRRVVPGRLLEDGFEFRYPQWQAAAVDLARQWRSERR